MEKVRYYLAEYAKKYKYFRYFLRKVLYLKNYLKYSIYLPYKVNDKIIIFESYNGRSYSDSPKFIYEYMITDPRFKDYTFVWAFKNISSHHMNNQNTIVVETNTKDYYKYYSKAKYWVVNSLVPEFIHKKTNQIYIQCWHGTPLKKLRYDIEVKGSVLNTTKEIRHRNDIDAKKIDYFLSPSSYASKCFISAFNLEKLNKTNVILETGYPRNDTLFTYEKKDIEFLKKKLNIPNDKKVILYAPTFRDNQHQSGLGYTYKLELDFDLLKKELGKDYVILFKTHYFISNSFDFNKYQDFIINVSDYEELNDLYIISDILLTDYSSVLFDYANLKKPMLFYMYDLKEYQNDIRGFYFNINELPGQITQTQEELIKEIKNYDSKLYTKKYQSFNKKFNNLDNSNTTKLVVDKIFKDIKEGEQNDKGTFN